MKKLKVLSNLAMVAALCAGTALVSSSQVRADKDAHISSVAGTAVVDLQKVLAELPVTKDIQKQLESLRQAFATEVKGYETELRNAEKNLIESQKKLSEAEFVKKREGFEKRIGEVQKIVEKRKEQLDKAFAEAMEKVNSKIMDAINVVSKEKGLSLVLFPMSVAYYAESLDISKEVSKIVKDTLTSVKIDLPKK